LAIVNSPAIKKGVQVSRLCADLHSFRNMVRSGLAGSQSSSIFSFLKSLHAGFHSGCTHFHSHRQ
jgi:hypothetical protein